MFLRCIGVWIISTQQYKKHPLVLQLSENEERQTKVWHWEVHQIYILKNVGKGWNLKIKTTILVFMNGLLWHFFDILLLTFLFSDCIFSIHRIKRHAQWGGWGGGGEVIVRLQNQVDVEMIITFFNLGGLRSRLGAN